MNFMLTNVCGARKIAGALIGLVFGALLQISDASPTINFPISEISVSQKAGSVTIPIEVTGEFEEYSWGETIEPGFTYRTQGGTTSSGTGYEGTSGTDWYFSKENSTIFISVPIYYTGSVKDLFFTVVVSNVSNAELGSTTAVTVTIKGEKPSPKINILTKKGPLNSKFTIYGNIANTADSQIKSVTLTINGQRMNLTGKKNWKVQGVRASSPGTYKMVVKAYLESGVILKKNADLYIY